MEEKAIDFNATPHREAARPLRSDSVERVLRSAAGRKSSGGTSSTRRWPTHAILADILFFLYESQLIYGRKINLRAIREAARRYYEEKIEAYFAMNRFLHESFSVRS